jgi:hypothetical protein
MDKKKQIERILILPRYNAFSNDLLKIWNVFPSGYIINVLLANALRVIDLRLKCVSGCFHFFFIKKVKI